MKRRISTARPLRWLSPKAFAVGALFLMSFVYLLAPPSWMVISSLSPDPELHARPPHWIPRTPTLEHYQTLFQLPGRDQAVLDQNPQVRALPRTFLNSCILAIGTLAICVFFGSISAYTLSRFIKRRHQRWILMGLLASRMVPVVAIIIPIYIAFQKLGLLNSLAGLILVYSGLLLPFVVWILEAFYRDFPRELEEAAAIDGCTPLMTFLRVVLPLSANGLIASAAFVFISVWSDFIVGLSLTSTRAAWPLSVALAQALNPITEPSWGLLNSAGFIAAVVPAAIAFAFRNAVMRGVFSGAVKG